MSYNILSVAADESSSSSSSAAALNRLIPEMVSIDTVDYQFLFDDLPFSPLRDSSSSDYDGNNNNNLQALLMNSSQSQSQSQANPVDCSEQFGSGNLVPSSPPTDQLENLSLDYQTTQYPYVENGYGNLNGLEVKSEECHQVDLDSAYGYGGATTSENVEVAKYLQRSFSSNCFEGGIKLQQHAASASAAAAAAAGFSFQPPLDSLMELQNFEGQAAFSLPENTLFAAAQLRKVCSTGDLEGMRNGRNYQNQSQIRPMENSLMEEAPFKVGRYNPEERQERISKYRAKRNQRNFNKTIKYACRKTLADSRPRIRGRFARNDETVEIPKAACSTRDIEDEDDLWALHEVDDETMGRAANYMSTTTFSQTHHHHHHHHQFQYYQYRGCF